MKSILIADDHPIMIGAVTETIKEVYPKVTIYTAKNWKAVNTCPKSCASIFILDLEMQGGEAVNKIKEINLKCPESKIIIFTSHCHSWVLYGLADCRIEGFVSKLSDPEEIIEAIKSLDENETFMCSEFRRVYLSSNEKPLTENKLTKREKDVLLLILKAKTTIEIARELNITVNTVETHRKNLFVKFDVKNVVGLVNKATVFGNSKRIL